MAAIYGIIGSYEEERNDIDSKFVDGDWLLAGSYVWYGANTEDDDGYDVIQPTGHTGPGRHIRIGRTNFKYPQGVLTTRGLNGFIDIVTVIAGGNGEATVNIDNNNTGTGTALFTEITNVSCTAVVNSANAVDMVIGCVKLPTTLNGSPKTVTCKFVKGLTLGSLGDSVELADNDTVVMIRVSGILPNN